MQPVEQSFGVVERDAPQPECAHDHAERADGRDGEALRRIASGKVVGQENRYPEALAEVKALLFATVEPLEALGLDKGFDVARVWLATDVHGQQLGFRDVALANDLSPHLFRSANGGKAADKRETAGLVEVDQRPGVGDGGGYFPSAQARSSRIAVC